MKSLFYTNDSAVPEEYGFMNSPLIKAYKVNTGKLAGPVRFVLLSDLHSRIYGEGNQSLIELVRDMRPDIILCAGDIILITPLLIFCVRFRRSPRSFFRTGITRPSIGHSPGADTEIISLQYVRPVFRS